MHILETPRLILRPPSDSDELLVHGLHSDPFVVNAVTGIYPTLEQSRAELLRFIDHWQRHRFGLWLVFVKDDGQAREFAGYCGLRCSGLRLPEDPDNIEIVTRLHLAASGRGIAVEAGRAVIEFAFEYLGLVKVTAFIIPTNVRSRLKNMKIGFVYIGRKLHNNNTKMYFIVTPGTFVPTDEVLS